MKSFSPYCYYSLAIRFMTVAWYGHLKFSEIRKITSFEFVHHYFNQLGYRIFEYCLMVPANRIGYKTWAVHSP